MKNAMKKLMAFALVAVMLVGVLPFGAFADEIKCADGGENCPMTEPNHTKNCYKACGNNEECWPAKNGLLEEELAL